VIDAALTRDFGRPVRAAVVDHEPLDRIDAGDVTGQRGECFWERCPLIEAWDLDDKFERS
jgi:hypothetical protein